MRWIIVTECGEVHRVKDMKQVDKEWDAAEAAGTTFIAFSDYGRKRISNAEARLVGQKAFGVI